MNIREAENILMEGFYTIRFAQERDIPTILNNLYASPLLISQQEYLIQIIRNNGQLQSSDFSERIIVAENHNGIPVGAAHYCFSGKTCMIESLAVTSQLNNENQVVYEQVKIKLKLLKHIAFASLQNRVRTITSTCDSSNTNLFAVCDFFPTGSTINELKTWMNLKMEQKIQILSEESTSVQFLLTPRLLARLFETIAKVSSEVSLGKHLLRVG